MQIANVAGRAVLVAEARALDIATASDGRFSADPAELYSQWADLLVWAEGVDVAADPTSFDFDPRVAGAPSPRPSQVFGIGLNYADHAREAGLAVPENPVVFTKFPSAVVGPHAVVALPSDTVDWEAELVVVIGVGGRRIPAADAPRHIAGYTVGQDLSERTVQWLGSPAQFSMGKSYEGFAPIGPVIVTDLADPENLAISTTIVGPDGSETIVQSGCTDQLIFGIPALIEWLSAIVELRPGDLIFTGTPPGVGAAMEPKRFLQSGERLVTSIEGIGSIEQTFSR